MKEKKFAFNFLAFFTAFSIGMLYVYIDTPRPRMIIKYPTPYNAENIVYKGLSGDCYKFKMEEVKCTKEAIEQPII
jgi:hypothetical protein